MAAILLASGLSRAQEAPPAGPPAGVPAGSPAVAPAIPPAGCGAGLVAAYEGERKARVLLRRRGTGFDVNPLRPLTRTPLVVVELVVDGRTAYAAGPDLARLRRLGGLGEVEAEEPVAWAVAETAPPAALRLVLEDGRAPFGNLAFAGCTAPPARRSASPARRQGPDADVSPGRTGRPAVDRSAPRLPQGAIPEGRTNLRE